MPCRREFVVAVNQNVFDPDSSNWTKEIKPSDILSEVLLAHRRIVDPGSCAAVPLLGAPPLPLIVNPLTVE